MKISMKTDPTLNAAARLVFSAWRSLNDTARHSTSLRHSRRMLTSKLVGVSGLLQVDADRPVNVPLNTQLKRHYTDSMLQCCNCIFCKVPCKIFDLPA